VALLSIAGCSIAVSSENPETASQTNPNVAPAQPPVETKDTANAGPPANAIEEAAVVPETESPQKPVVPRNQIEAGIDIPAPEHKLEDGDYRWSQLLARDAIFPVYDPEFAPADSAPYTDDELVIGVEINGEARAYAIGPLNRREMVNDTVGGVPVLVTW